MPGGLVEVVAPGAALAAGRGARAARCGRRAGVRRAPARHAGGGRRGDASSGSRRALRGDAAGRRPACARWSRRSKTCSSRPSSRRSRPMRSGIGLRSLAAVPCRARAWRRARPQDQPVLQADARRGAGARARGEPSPGGGARARGRGAGRRGRARGGRAAARDARSAGYTRTNHVLEFVVPGADGRARACSIPTCPTTTARAWTCSGRSTPAAAPTRSSARRAPKPAAAAAETAVARADLRLEVARAFWAVVTARAAVAVLEQARERGRGATWPTCARA